MSENFDWVTDTDGFAKTMTDTNSQQQQNFAVRSQIAAYMQQLILHDTLAKVIEAQEKGGDYLPLLKSLSDCAESQGNSTALERAPAMTHRMVLIRSQTSRLMMILSLFLLVIPITVMVSVVD